VTADVRFGSKADIGLALVDVRFTPKADIAGRQVNVRFVPKADICGNDLRREKVPGGLPENRKTDSRSGSLFRCFKPSAQSGSRVSRFARLEHAWSC
jgi:hypothetical protein